MDRLDPSLGGSGGRNKAGGQREPPPDKAGGLVGGSLPGCPPSKVSRSLPKDVPDVSTHFLTCFRDLADPGIVRNGSGASFLGPRGRFRAPGMAFEEMLDVNFFTPKPSMYFDITLIAYASVSPFLVQ